LGSGRGGSSGGSQGSIGPKGVAVCFAMMKRYLHPKYNMLVDAGSGDGRMLVYGQLADMFKYLRGTESGGELPVMTERIKQWMRCVDRVGKDTDHDIEIELYRHECSITRPAGLSRACRVAVWHFHQGWEPAHIERVREWLARFKVAVYVSVSPGYGGGFAIDGFVHVSSVTVAMTGQHGQSRARVFVRTDLVESGS
jgi:hypothetical protein